MVSLCLPLGVFRETPPPASMTYTVRPSSSLIRGSRLFRRGLGRQHRALFSTGRPRERDERDNNNLLGIRGF